jgi:nitroimidazol reductase NimA-like FMN-containing flavoprotein (pyridoxamine 5'-phosphate oxidase superfamily)
MHRPIRRNERIMSGLDATELLRKSTVGRLGTSSSKEPYVVPLNFVYYDGRIFFHCAKEGKKLDNIKNNQKVCFEVDELIEIKEAEKSCEFGAFYRSVIVFGEARIIDNIDLKRHVLKELIKKYAPGTEDPILNPISAEVEKTTIVEIHAEHMTGKQRLKG